MRERVYVVYNMPDVLRMHNSSTYLNTEALLQRAPASAHFVGCD